MSGSRNFRQLLTQGQAGESTIARWFISRGNAVLPVYEKEIDTGKGPQLFCLDGQFAAPDLLLFSAVAQRIIWIEAKHKSVFSWHRLTGRWTTGIDLRHYKEYRQVEKRTGWPVWLMFLHAKDRDLSRPREPWPCPTGLYGAKLSDLANCENHRSSKWAKGMVYWRESSLHKFAELGDLNIGDDVINTHNPNYRSVPA